MNARVLFQKRLGLVGTRATRDRHSINRHPIGKRKFVAQGHVDLKRKILILPIQKTGELAKIDNVKTSPERQVKARHFLGAVIACLCGAAVQMSAGEDADLIFVNGNIYTVNERQLHAEAVAVKNERIAFVGSNDDAKKFHAAQVVDLHGKTVVSGLTDSHRHIFGIGEREMRLNLEGTNTLEDLLAKVKERAASTERGKWITAVAGYAMNLVAKNIPKPTEAEREQAFLLGIDREVKLGWCEIQNAGSDANDIKIIRKCLDDGKVKLRLINAVYGPGKDAQNFLREGSTINAYNHHFTQHAIKVR